MPSKNETNSTPFTKWLRTRRKELRLTQSELAERADLSFSAIQKLESGGRRPSQQVAELLAHALDIEHGERARFLSAARGVESPGEGEGEPGEVSPPTNLPAQLTTLIGREEPLQRVVDLLGSPDVRFLTLTGPPGIGKTRLALQAGSLLLPKFEDGVFLVALAPVRDPSLVLRTIAAAAGVREKGTEPLTLTLKEYLRSKKVLLVLDNFEQVISAARQVVELLWSCPHVKMLVTSREALHVRGEYRDPVPSLELDASMQLFMARTQEVQPSFSLTPDNEAVVRDICSRMEGLPLAIELVAARVRFSTPRALLVRLEQAMDSDKMGALPLLVGGPRDLPERHKTLSAAIEWSYNLLDLNEQRLFLRLGEFVGGFTPSSADAVCNARGDLGIDVAEGLLSLLDKNLIKREAPGEGLDESEEIRYLMLEMIHEYAYERLVESGEDQKVQGWFLQYFLALTEAARFEVTGKSQKQWMLKLDGERSNIRIALRRAIDSGELEVAGRICVALSTYWYLRGTTGEGRTWCDEVLEHKEIASLPASLQIELHSGAGFLASTQSALTKSIEYLDRSLALIRATGEDKTVMSVLNTLGLSYLLKGEYENAITKLEEVVAICKEGGLPRGAGIGLHNLAVTALFMGDNQKVESLEAEAIPILLEAGSTWDACLANGILGIALCRMGQLERAEEVCEGARAIFEGSDHNDSSWAVGLIALAEVARVKGNYKRASELYRDSLRRLRSGGVFPPIFFGLIGIGFLEALDGDAERAVTLFGALEGAQATLGVKSVVPSNRADFEHGMDLARAALEGLHWKRAWKKGVAMSLDKAIAFALGEAE